MKKIIALLLTLATVFAFVACNNAKNDEGASAGSAAKESVTIVEYVADGEDIEYTVDLSALESKTAFAALNYLKTEKGVKFEYSDSQYGALVSAFGSLTTDYDAKRSVYFWTSVQSDWDVSAYATEKTYKDTKLVSSGEGVSTMKVEDKAIIYVGYTTW